MSRLDHFDDGAQMVPLHVVSNWVSGDAGDPDTPGGRRVPVRGTYEDKRKSPQYAEVRDSVAQHGIQRPVFASSFARPHAVLDDGHHRLAAAAELGMTHVPVNTGYLHPDDLREHKVEYRYTGVKPNTGGKTQFHVVEAHHPVFGKVGSMEWHTREVHDLAVDRHWRRQGVATGLWEHANSVANGRSIPAPKHSTQRTTDGDAWARSVGGRLPRLDRR